VVQRWVCACAWLQGEDKSQGGALSLSVSWVVGFASPLPAHACMRMCGLQTTLQLLCIVGRDVVCGLGGEGRVVVLLGVGVEVPFMFCCTQA
jgi:hypothetical protein